MSPSCAVASRVAACCLVILAIAGTPAGSVAFAAENSSNAAPVAPADDPASQGGGDSKSADAVNEGADAPETAQNAGSAPVENAGASDSVANGAEGETHAPVAAGEQESTTDSGDAAPQSGTDGAASTAEAAAAAVDIEEADSAEPFDPTKAKPSELKAYNEKLAPDDRFVCRRDRDAAAVGARFSAKTCLTVRQWRERGR